MNAVKNNEGIVNELMAELDVIERDLINLEDRRDSIIDRILELREGSR